MSTGIVVLTFTSHNVFMALAGRTPNITYKPDVLRPAGQIFLENLHREPHGTANKMSGFKMIDNVGKHLSR